MTPPEHAPADLTGIWVERHDTIIGILDDCDQLRLAAELRRFWRARPRAAPGGGGDPSAHRLHRALGP